jgi:hypothetical protein
VTLLDAVMLDLRNSLVVLAGDQQLRDRLRQSAWAGSAVNEHIVMLRAQQARFVNEASEKGWKILGLTE